MMPPSLRTLIVDDSSSDPKIVNAEATNKSFHANDFIIKPVTAPTLKEKLTKIYAPKDGLTS